MELLERVTLNPNHFSLLQTFPFLRIWSVRAFLDGHAFRNLKWFATTLGFPRGTLALILAFTR
jgi:hypothetical protein